MDPQLGAAGIAQGHRGLRARIRRHRLPGRPQGHTVPVLVVHGDADNTVPIKVSGARTAQMLPGAQYKVYEGAPHGLYATHKEELNRDLVAFIKGG